MKYTFEQVREATEKYFKGDELAASVFAGKYALQDNDGNILELTPDDMHRRLAKEFARIEKKYANPMSEEEVYELFKNFAKVIPQGSPMSGIGNPYQVQSISNCFVIQSPYDSYSGILKTDQEQVQIMKRRGGVGMDVSSIRPRGMKTANAAKTTDGIGVFMERYSNSTREVAQGGRRGALMISISVHHPEIRTFINIKRDKKKVTGANISIRLTDEFMEAVVKGEKFHLRFPVDPDVPHIKEEWVDARELWDEIIEAAWESAEPGLLFWDTAKKYTPSDIYSQYGFGSVSTNPCGEIILSPYDSCRLLLVNLTAFVKDPFTKNASFDWAEYGDVVVKAQRLMDDMIDLELECIERILAKIENDPEPEDVKRIELDLWLKIKDAAIKGRRTGLGITGLGDALAGLNIQYGSDASVFMTEEIYKNLAINSYRSSVKMAKERGAFPIFSHDLEKNHPFLERIWTAAPDVYAEYLLYGRRNIANTTTAPAGSVSTMTQTTSGIENAFLLSYTRRRKINPNETDVRVDFVDDLGDKWTEYKVYHHWFKKWMDVTGKDDPAESPYHGATSNDVNWVKKVEIQAAAQKWICHSISNTTNIPNDTPKEVVAQIYMKGWETGCKGVTIYRDGSRTGVLVSDSAKKEDNKFMDNDAPKRPEELECDIHRVNIKGEAWTILVGKLEGRPYEIFGGLSKFIEISKKHKVGKIIKHASKKAKSTYDLVVGEEGDEYIINDVVNAFDNPTHGAFTRTLSLALRHGAPVQYMVEQLQKDDKESDMFSFSRVIARVLKGYIVDGTKVSGKTCQNCGSDQIRYQEGCATCVQCGSSKCG